MTGLSPSLLSGSPCARRLWVGGEILLVTLLTWYLSLQLQRPVLWLVVPLSLLLLRREPLPHYGLVLRFHPPSLTGHLRLGTAALVLYTAGSLLIVQVFQGQEVGFSIPQQWLSLLFSQLFAVAVPEEFFFRGYLQTTFNREFGTPYRLCGAHLGAGWLVQAGAFALCHLPQGSWVSLRVFFFALLAGWLRDRSGSLLAPAVYHGLGNVWTAVLK